MHNMWHYAHERGHVVLGCPLEPPLGLLTAVIFADSAAVRVLKLKAGGLLSESTEWGSDRQPCSSFCFVKAILRLCNKEELVSRQVLSKKS